MIAELIRRSLTTSIAPMVYIMMGMSVLIGLMFATGVSVSHDESVLYNTGVLVHRSLWGAALFVTASLALFGFATNRDSLVSLGGIAGFCLWLFATIALFLEQHWYIFITVGLLHLLFHGYVVLASALGVIRRPPIL